MSVPAASKGGFGRPVHSLHASDAYEEAGPSVATPRAASSRRGGIPNQSVPCNPPELPLGWPSGPRHPVHSLLASDAHEETGPSVATPRAASRKKTRHSAPEPPSPRRSVSPHSRGGVGSKDSARLRVCLKAANKEIESVLAQLDQQMEPLEHVQASTSPGMEPQLPDLMQQAALRLMNEVVKVVEIVGVDQATVASLLAKATRHEGLEGMTRARVDAEAPVVLPPAKPPPRRRDSPLSCRIDRNRQCGLFFGDA